MRLAPAIAFAALVVCVSAASGATVTGRIVFAANNAPTWSGHIYVSHGGRAPLDLSANSPGLDFAPAVSPDGSRIAFVSYRGGHTAVYVMRVDGTHATRVSPYLGTGGSNGSNTIVESIAWGPDGRSFAALVGMRSTGKNSIYAATPSGGWRVLVPARRSPTMLGGWARATGWLVYVSQETGAVQAVDSNGKLQFAVPGEAVAVSPRGELAVQRDGDTWILYSARGKQLTKLRDVAAAVWSPDGSLLATMSAKGTLRIRRAGKATVSARIPQAQLLGWLGNRIVRLEGATVFGVSATTGRRVPLPRGFRQFFVVSTESRAATVDYPPIKPGGTARVLTGALGSASRTVATFPVCADAAVVSDLQLFGKDGLAYDTSCPGAQADIYTVEPDGSDIRRLTTSPFDDAQPAVSPDGTRIAYVQQDNEVHCPGCTETLHVMNADGTGTRSFPNSTDPNLQYDADPSFSPDGKTILFVRAGPDATGLFTVPTAGGPVRNLHLSGSNAVWGPSRIAYNAWPPGTLTTVASDGTGKTPVKGVHGDGVAAWSADGRIAYLQTDRQGRFVIALPATGKTIPLLQFTSYGRLALAWSPDGTRLAFVATDHSGISDVWTIRIDGTHLKRVTRGLGAVTSVAWR